MGRKLRCFNPNWNMRLFRRGHGRMEDLELHDVPGTGDNEIHEHVKVDGATGYLRTPLRHDDDRGLTAWLERHNRYATWEAHLYRKFRREPIGVGPVGFLRLDRVPAQACAAPDLGAAAAALASASWSGTSPAAGSSTVAPGSSSAC